EPVDAAGDQHRKQRPLGGLVDRQQGTSSVPSPIAAGSHDPLGSGNHDSPGKRPTGHRRESVHHSAVESGSMFERYNEKARRVVFYARYQATALGDPEIRAIPLLLALLGEAKALFFKLELPEGNLEALRAACVRESLGGEPIPASADMAVDEETKRILSRAIEEADSRKDNEVDVEHLLLGSLHVPNKANDIFHEHGITYEKVSARLRRGDSPLGDALDYT